jgi:hypothetical protein
MVMLEDFTALSPGRDVPLEGRIDRCPECGRNGVPHDEPDGTFYVHVQVSELLSDGMLTEPRDCCRLPPHCHSEERSDEESLPSTQEILRFAQDDRKDVTSSSLLRLSLRRVSQMSRAFAGAHSVIPRAAGPRDLSLGRTRSLATLGMTWGWSLLVLFGLAATPALAADVREIHRTVALDAGGTVALRTFKGSIEVEPWGEPQADVFARIEADTSCGNDSQQSERVRLTEVDFESTGSRLEVRSNYDKLEDFAPPRAMRPRRSGAIVTRSEAAPPRSAAERPRSADRA